LRSNRRELDEALTRNDYRGITTRVGLSSAERELLRTSRAELAYWLNVICFRRLTEDEETKRYCTRFTEGGREYSPPSSEDLSNGACDAIEAAATLGVDDLGAADLLASACAPRLRGSPPGRPGVCELAAASLRLQPTFQARHYAIQCNVTGAGTGRRELGAAARLVELVGTPSDFAHASGLLGTCLGILGQPLQAMQAYLRAAASLPGHSEFLVRSLLEATYAGIEAARRELARELEHRHRGMEVMRRILARAGAPVGIPGLGAIELADAVCLRRPLHSEVNK